MVRKVLFGAAVLLTLLVVPAQADPGYDPAYDIDRNGEINVVDIMLVAAHWRETGTWSCSCISEPAPVPKTGQTKCYTDKGVSEQDCPATGWPGQDGDLQKGVTWPSPRFTDNGDGTVTDNLTGLMWMQNADAGNDCQGADTGDETWANALASAAACNASAGFAGYTDWRLPNVRELFSLIDFSQEYPPLPSGHPFTGVHQSTYWSSTTSVTSTDAAWNVGLSYGSVWPSGKVNSRYVWPVRGGQ